MSSTCAHIKRDSKDNIVSAVKKVGPLYVCEVCKAYSNNERDMTERHYFKRHIIYTNGLDDIKSIKEILSEMEFNRV